MGYPAKRDYQINQRLRYFIDSNDKKPSILADKAGIRRDTFSAILNCRRPIFASEIVPISTAVGCSIQYLLGLEQQDAALVLKLQERQKPEFVPETSDGPCRIGPMVEGGITASDLDNQKHLCPDTSTHDF